MKTLFAIIVLLLLNILQRIQSATTTHHKHTISTESNNNKERVIDGVYRSRDAHHYHGDGDGEHNVEFDHEAIIGSIKEAEEFDQLTPEESKKRLQILIEKMDTNSDQFIDRHELKAWILRSFKSLSEEEANLRFDDVDQNNDNEISWMEYLKDTYDMADEDNEIPNNDGVNINDEDRRPRRSEEEEKLIGDDREMFNASDANKDGVLNAQEFVVFLSPEEHPEMLPIILKQTLRDRDQNADGKIDFQEFIGESGKNHDKEWIIEEKERFDTDYDIDKDGILNGNEILSWIVPSNDEVAEDEVEHLFSTSDDDQNNRLAYHEILNNYETFVGSEATDYGEYLHNIDNHFPDEL